MGVAKSFLSLEVLVFRFRLHFSLAADAVRSPRFAYATEFPQFSRDIPTDRFARELRRVFLSLEVLVFLFRATRVHFSLRR